MLASHDDAKYRFKIMSVQFGRWSFDGTPPLPNFLESVNTVLAPYGPDSSKVYQQDGVSVLYRAFHTSKESHSEIQPHISPSGTVVVWDGRLDNRAEFIGLMSDKLGTDSPECSVVASAYERWGPAWGGGGFARLIGDWAVSIWDPLERQVILAKDFIGTRHLYYSVDSDRACWSTILGPRSCSRRSPSISTRSMSPAGFHSFLRLVSLPILESIRSPVLLCPSSEGHEQSHQVLGL